MEARSSGLVLVLTLICEVRHSNTVTLHFHQLHGICSRIRLIQYSLRHANYVSVSLLAVVCGSPTVRPFTWLCLLTFLHQTSYISASSNHKANFCVLLYTRYHLRTNNPALLWTKSWFQCYSNNLNDARTSFLFPPPSYYKARFSIQQSCCSIISVRAAHPFGKNSLGWVAGITAQRN